jgi:hypothetical protein
MPYDKKNFGIGRWIVHFRLPGMLFKKIAVLANRNPKAIDYGQ